ncbi:NAD(P)-dependent oxidoreductase [Streptomyces sp. NA02950]|uniref:NAD(P)-dependent oxidoreductase n=1 Tax=Streptomyces sp. NA02950 TaxID=2742137 RepID=UPI00158FFB4C|nr:NAD(P)-dependent oxidoreductase [Streptomyces sp. NA02950]QKV96394.1 NAD(P)-dependent oxidoreductase [Streptomyces sp. NA02950]
MSGRAPDEWLAVVGLGRLGAAVAGRLVDAGYQVSGFDVSAAATAHADAMGVRTGDSCAAAVRGAATVITVLPDATVVASVAPEILAAMEPDACWLEMSSSHPEVTRALAADAERRGLALLDVPVAGGVAGAERGVLTVMAAGPAPLLERARPVLEVFGKRIIHVSERPGDGDIAKTINNLLAAANLAAASEGLALGLAEGLDVEVLLEVVNAGSGTSFATTAQIPGFALEGRYTARFTVGQYAKDAQVALDLAGRRGMNPAMLTRARDLWQVLADDGHADDDYTRITPLVAGAAGVEWPAPRTEEA